MSDDTRKGPLDGIVVVDLTRVLAGPYLTMMLSDMGARVIKVEIPETGDDARHFPPFVEGESAYFATINRGKESITLDLKNNEDREVFEKLVRRSDVLVENFRAGTMDKLGYDWDSLAKINAGLVYAAVSGFGHTGPYSDRPAYDLVVQGMGGVMSMTGTKETAPMRVGTSIGDIAAGMFGLSGVLAAIYDREKTGKGCKIDVGMLDCQVALLENAISRYFADGKVPGPIGIRHPSITPFAGLRAKHNEYVILAAGNDKMFAHLCRTIGCPELIEDPRFVTNPDRTEHCDALYEELEKVLAHKTSAEWLDVLNQAGIPCGPINDIGHVVEDPHVLERNMIVSAMSGTGAEFRMPGNPIKLSSYHDPDTRQAAPALDGHRDSIMAFINGD